MGSNTFGQVLCCTTWGESHGKAMGVVIDGCPAGLALSEEEISLELRRRAPGQTPWTSPRQESDEAEILSGVYEGITTGAPISILIKNRDARPSSYTANQKLLRPGHANFTYLEKYGVFDHRGGGRASARETVCRVAAGAVARKLLSDVNVTVVAFLRQVGSHTGDFRLSDDASRVQQKVYESPLFCPCPDTEKTFMQVIDSVKVEGDSIGGVVEAIAWGVPTGWGDPVYRKLESQLAMAMLSIPACKSFEIGTGRSAAAFNGSEHNDVFVACKGKVQTDTNHAGGVLGGISTGMPIVIQAAFKPPSSIAIPQQTVDINGQSQLLELSKDARHDPCVAIRAAPVVEAMMLLVLADAYLMQRLSRK